MPKDPVYSDEALLEALRDYARWLGRAPTYKEMAVDRGVMPSAATFRQRFGSWRAALAAAGLERGRAVPVSREQVVAAFQRVADELGRMPRPEEWPYPPIVVRRHFASPQELRLVVGFDAGAGDAE